MSSDISFHKHSTPDLVSYEYDDASVGHPLFFSHPYPFSSIDVPQGNFNNSLHPSFLSFTPLENDLLYQVNPVSDAPNIKGESRNFSALDDPEVITEECQVRVDYAYNHQFISQSGSMGAETASASKLIMQRSFSCNSFNGKPGFYFEPHMDFDQWHALNSPENTFFNEHMRRVCSTGDLQNMKATDMSPKESPLLEEASFKVGRYSAEERKEKISKYRAKRSQRKFNKIIKYACRKTLADNRTRIRGRFARNDESSEIARAPCSTTEEYEDEFWVEFLEGLEQNNMQIVT